MPIHLVVSLAPTLNAEMLQLQSELDSLKAKHSSSDLSAGLFDVNIAQSVCTCGTLKRVVWYFEEGGVVL